MKNLKSIIFYTYLVKVMAYMLIPITIINLVVKWFYPEMIFSNHFIAGFFHGYLPSESVVTTMPLLHRLIATTVDSIAVILFLAILFVIIEMMNRIQQSELFSTLTVTQFTFISKLAFFLVLYEPINHILLSVITTMHNESGQRILAVTFGFSDLINILIFGFFMVMTLLMQQATSLQNEHNLTV